MLKNYLKVALRNLLRYRGNAFINLSGLALGLAAAIVLGLYVAHERSFDRFHAHADRLFLLAEEVRRRSGVESYTQTRTPVLPALLAELPELAGGTRLMSWGTPSMGYGGRRVDVAFTCVDSIFFDVFSFPVLQGDARAALTRPDAVVLTTTAAQALFGSEDPLGKTLDYAFGEGTFTVLAVAADPPPNSSIRFEMLGGWAHIDDVFSPDGLGSWYNAHTPTYVLLREGVPAEALTARLRRFAEDRFEVEEAEIALRLRPLTALHREAGDDALLTLLGLFAVAIVLIACINFTNLATARALGRAREIGMRKVVGAQRGQLVLQFFGESLLTGLLALVLGVGLAELTLPFFNSLFDLPLRIEYARHGPALLALGAAIGLAAGLYPALYLSGLQPIRSLQAQPARGPSGRRLRQGLVVVQFALSALLLIGTVVVWGQIRFMKGTDVRFDRENVIVMPVLTEPFGSADAANARLRSARAALLADPAVHAASFSESVPGRYLDYYNTFYRQGDEATGLKMRHARVDAHFFETYGITLRAGTAFSATSPAENAHRVVINERAAGQLAAREAGARFRTGGDDAPLEVAGIVEDFHYRSLERTIEPLVHFYGGEAPAAYRYLSVRLRPGAAGRGVALLRAQWEALYPGLAFEYFFIDDTFDALYRTQERIGSLATAFALVTLLIACLGLFSLLALSIRVRTKEVGIRKALGASTTSIVVLLSTDFLRLVALAFVAAAPVAYLLMRRWLEGFAYRIEIGPGVFLLAGALMLGVALATVGYQALRAALSDPVESLRYE